mmetsp:Transcript_79041/g.115808  ORF Transcript_79041/g.115808 Transcript_79041/m.115808 type:complete len:243 (-) Transcript_79041:1780-2508(-)
MKKSFWRPPPAPSTSVAKQYSLPDFVTIHFLRKIIFFTFVTPPPSGMRGGSLSFVPASPGFFFPSTVLPPVFDFETDSVADFAADVVADFVLCFLSDCVLSFALDSALDFVCVSVLKFLELNLVASFFLRPAVSSRIFVALTVVDIVSVPPRSRDTPSTPSRKLCSANSNVPCLGTSAISLPSSISSPSSCITLSSPLCTLPSPPMPSSSVAADESALLLLLRTFRGAFRLLLLLLRLLAAV